MGIIDKTTVKLRCPSCDQSETLTAIEKGSVYGSSGWNDFNESTYFNVSSIDEGIGGPQIVSARCKKCDCDAVRDKV
jgi:hypothetical protein